MSRIVVQTRIDQSTFDQIFRIQTIVGAIFFAQIRANCMTVDYVQAIVIQKWQRVLRINLVAARERGRKKKKTDEIS